MLKPYPLALIMLVTAALLSACSSTQTHREKPAAKPETPSAETAPVLKPDAQQVLLQQAQQGDVQAQFQLGSSYFVGQPVKDLKQAEYWWKQAADKGQADAAVSLAYLYTGRDVPEFANQREMLRYLNQAAAANNPLAQHILGTLYLRGEAGVQRDPDQARRLYESACKQRYEASCRALGR